MTETAAVAHDLFISYAEADRAWVDGFLLDALEQAGVKYHSEDAFALGVPRLVEFERAIKQSTRTLLILSPAYLADTFGQFVDVLVNSYGMETATWPVIPLLLQPVDELPPRLSQLSRLDATSAAGQQAALARLCAELKRPVPGLAPLPACPYPGMVPFDEADSARFFGREQEVQELVERLRLQPFLAVIGASGSGKSSLVRAGLIPALRKSRLFGSGDWAVRVMRPGATPLAALASAINIVDLLNARQSGGRTLLVVDQFEETFTLAGEQGPPFQQTLLQLAAAPGCYVVLTVRADFYADLMTSPLWEQIQAHRAEVTPLGEAGLRRAIMRPAEQAGVAIEAALVERLLADAAGEPGVLPLVQETLVLLWEKLERRFLPMRAYQALVLSRSAYNTLDGSEPTGLQVAIARRADATLAELTETQQLIVRRIFLRLIQFGEGRADTRRQQPVSALQSAGDDPAAFDTTLQRLAASRLLTLSGAETKDQRPTTNDQSSTNGGATPSSFVLRPSSVRVDISHEALIGGWPALQGWLKERREGELARRRLEGKVQEWVRLGKGNGGLLDEIEVLEAERWLQSPDADEMGFDEALPELVTSSRAELEAEEQAREAARRRELEQAQALAAEQQRHAEEQAAASRRLRRRAAGLVALLVVAVVAIGIAVWSSITSQQNASTAQTAQANAEKERANAETQKTAADAASRRAEREQRQARAGELSAQARAGQKEFASRSLLLAIEAINTTKDLGEPRVPAAEDALREVVARIDGRLLDGDLLNFNNHMLPSPDRNHIATLDKDAAIRIWDITAPDPSAHPLVLRPSGVLGSITWSADGHKIAVGRDDGTIWVWDITIAEPGANGIVFDGPSGEWLDFELSPDGHWLVLGNESIQLVDLTVPTPVVEPPITSRIGGGSFKSVLFSPNSHWLAIQQENSVLLRNLAASSRSNDVTTLPNSGGMYAFSPDSRWLITSRSDATLRWDISAANPATSAEQLSDVGSTFATFSPDGRLLTLQHAEGTAHFLDLAASSRNNSAGEQLTNLDAYKQVIFSPHSQAFAGRVERSDIVKVWSISAGQVGAEPVELRQAGTPIAFDADGRHLLTLAADTARVWDLSAADPNAAPTMLQGHASEIDTAVFSPDQRHVVTASTDLTVRFWDIDALQRVVLPVAVDGIWTVAGADRVASQNMSHETEVWAWDGVANGAAPHREILAVPPEGNQLLALSADGSRLASVSEYPFVVRTWDMTMQPTRGMSVTVPITSDTSGLEALGTFALSHDGRMLAILRNGSTVQVWSLTGTSVVMQRELLISGQLITPLAFNRDDHLLAIGIADKRIELWDVADPGANAPRATLDTNASLALFSPNGQTLLTGGLGNSWALWDLTGLNDRSESISLRRSLRGHATIIEGIKIPAMAAFSPNPQSGLLVTLSRAGEARLWDLNADPESPPIIITGINSFVEFAPDGQSLVTIGDKGEIRHWPLDLNELIRRACAAAGRNLTWDEWQQYIDTKTHYHQTCAQWPLHATYITHLLDDALDQARQGKVAEALAGYSSAQHQSQPDAISPDNWNDLCRSGLLWGHVKDVLDACGQAVAVSPQQGDYHDSRGLARALTGGPGWCDRGSRVLHRLGTKAHEHTSER